ncbi:M1 family metallopeptidase [Bergeyella sp. RCAD1439]|uniref:M1 family metallopeptidase n=1 Tax=Bergeyella anatis TaxID=3113737 RepID=UPI002E17C335|nr:M1 family metallopeptidase [Bergeyella sp. RCAD1439]
MNKLFGLLFFCFYFALQAQKQPYYQQFAKYQMEIDVDASNFTYKGKQTITYTNHSPDELGVVYFHLYWNAFKPGSMMDQRVQSQGVNGDSRLQQGGVSRLSAIPPDQEGAQNIHWIRQDGKKLKFEVQETIMKVELAEPLKPKGITTFTMEWDAVIPMQIRRSGRNNREGIDMTMTQWYPKLAEYDYEGWHTFDYIGREFHAPFSDYEVSIKIDGDYVIGAGGVLQNPSEVKGYTSGAQVKTDSEGKATWHWTAKNLLDFAWAADRDYTVEEFTVLDGPKIYYVYQKNEQTAFWEESKPYVARFFQIMNATFGRYEYPSYAFIQGGDGGMEYGMCTMILGQGRSFKGLVGLMVHEGAHSWFQQMLASNESMRPWIDEGFTSYAESLVMHQLFPPEQPEPNPFVSSIASYVNFTKTGKETPAVWLADHHDDGRAYSVASYTKGELFLVQLGYIVGERNMQLIMKEFFNQWKMKHPSDRDFLHIAQKVSGMDLKWFFHYWINTTKTIDYAIKNVEFGDGATTVTLVNNGTVPMPIDFSVLTKDGRIVNFQIPLNMTRVWKSDDIYGTFTTLPYWPWTQKKYVFKIPFTKDEISALGIDFSQRLADVNPSDNYMEFNASVKP